MSDNLSPLGHPKGRQDPVSGKWKRNGEVQGSVGGETVDLRLAITPATLDAAVIYTLDPGIRLLVERTFLEVVTPFTGGTASAIGLSTNVDGLDDKGALAGGATGEVAAGLVAGIRAGTAGTAFAGGAPVILEPETQIRFDRVTDAFTAGLGYFHIIGRVIA